MPVYIGIDWSQTKHHICILNEMGAPLGLAASECLVGIETAHNLLIDSP